MKSLAPSSKDIEMHHMHNLQHDCQLQTSHSTELNTGQRDKIEHKGLNYYFWLSLLLTLMLIVYTLGSPNLPNDISVHIGGEVPLVHTNVSDHQRVLTTTTTWYESSSPALQWTGITSSDNGQFLAASAYNKGIYFSLNYGRNWTVYNEPKIVLKKTETLNWSGGIAMNSSGEQVIAIEQNTGIYISFDYGLNWTLSLSGTGFGTNSANIASSSSGLILAAPVCGDVEGTFVSINSGANWTLLANPSTATCWGGFAMDSSGTRFVATVYFGIYISNNTGVSWYLTSAQTDYSGESSYYAVASDSSGQYLTASYSGNVMVISSNSGMTWGSSYLPGECNDIVMDSSGQHQQATCIGKLYNSVNFGVVWIESTTTIPSTINVEYVTSDSSGIYLAATGVVASNDDGSAIYLTDNLGTTFSPTSQPTSHPSHQPIGQPTRNPTQPTGQPTGQPSRQPSIRPSIQPSQAPSIQPSSVPTTQPTSRPTQPTSQPSDSPSTQPTKQPVSSPSFVPSSQPSVEPSEVPSNQPSSRPSCWPSMQPTTQPTKVPSFQPSRQPSSCPSTRPSTQPVDAPSGSPSSQPSNSPSAQPLSHPTAQPSRQPSGQPSLRPSVQPSEQPTSFPTVDVKTFQTMTSVESFTPSFISSLTNLGSGSVYITVNLLLSYLSQTSGGFVTVTAGSGDSMIVVTPECATITACDSDNTLPSMYCAVNIDVTHAIATSYGGSLALTASTNTQGVSGTTPALCNRPGQNGIYFELNYTVSTFLQPTQRPTPAPTAIPVSVASTTIITNHGLVTTGGAPFYLIAFVIAAFTAIGVLLVRFHDKSDVATPLSLIGTCSDFAMKGNSLVSELFYIVLLFQVNELDFTVLTVILVFARLLNSIAAVFLLHTMYRSHSELFKLLDESLLTAQAKLYSVLQMLVMFDVTLFKYLPWVKSEFTEKAAGFPNVRTFQICMYTKLVQSAITLIIQAFVLQKLNHLSNGNDYTIGLFILNIVMSIIMFVSVCLTVCLHLRVLRNVSDVSDHSKQPEKPSDILSTDNPIFELTEMQPKSITKTAKDSPRVTVLEQKVANMEQEIRELKEMVKSLIEERKQE